jgi:hypothetical protein
LSNALTFVVVGSTTVETFGEVVEVGDKFCNIFIKGVDDEVKALDGEVGGTVRACGFLVKRTPNKCSPTTTSKQSKTNTTTTTTTTRHVNGGFMYRVKKAKIRE